MFSNSLADTVGLLFALAGIGCLATIAGAGALVYWLWSHISWAA